jgi:hypothetical protein
MRVELIYIYMYKQEGYEDSMRGMPDSMRVELDSMRVELIY